MGVAGAPVAATTGKKIGEMRPNEYYATADTIHDNVAAEISAITEKTAMISSDKGILEDSADSHNKKMFQFTNLFNMVVCHNNEVVCNNNEVVTL